LRIEKKWLEAKSRIRGKTKKKTRRKD